MHELALTQEIVAAVLEQSAGDRVTRVRLEIGKLSGVAPEAVRFCFQACAQGTAAEGAELVIGEPPGRAHCRSCGAEPALQGPLAPCSCGSFDLEWLSGHELLIRDMEVLRCVPPAAVPARPARA